MSHQYLHTAKYGNPGGKHTMKPMFVKKDNLIFKSRYHPDVVSNREEGRKAIYSVQGSKIFAAEGHPNGPSPHALFEIRDNGKIHTTRHNSEHDPNQHVFVLGGEKPDQNFIDKVINNA